MILVCALWVTTIYCDSTTLQQITSISATNYINFKTKQVCKNYSTRPKNVTSFHGCQYQCSANDVDNAKSNDYTNADVVAIAADDDADDCDAVI